MNESLPPEAFALRIPEFSYEMIYVVEVALVVGIVLSTVMRWTNGWIPKRKTRRGDFARVLEAQQVHILLCVSGAFMMILIGRSLANALGLVGALSIIHFRTDLISPREATRIIVLLTVGMACGLKLFALAIFMTGLISVILIVFSLYHARAVRLEDEQWAVHQEPGTENAAEASCRGEKIPALASDASALGSFSSTESTFFQKG